MNEKEKLISRLKALIKRNDEKQLQYQHENGLSEEVGCLTREAYVLVTLIPEMERLGIKISDFSTKPPIFSSTSARLS